MAKKSCQGCRTKFMCADRWGRFRGNDRIRRLPRLVNRLLATCSPTPTSRRGRKPLIDQHANTKANGISTSAEYFDRTGRAWRLGHMGMARTLGARLFRRCLCFPPLQFHIPILELYIDRIGSLDLRA